jgi:hypothetical protein
MPTDRLSHLKKQYNNSVAQLNAYEADKTHALSLGDKVKIQQKIDEEVSPLVEEWKQKYLDALASETPLDLINDEQAEVIIDEIKKELTNDKFDAATSETLALIKQVLSKLDGPENPALLLKLGVKVPLGLVEAGVEFEGDAIALWKEHCPTFESWRQKAAKKILPPA